MEITTKEFGRPKVYLALPSYDRRIDLGAAVSFSNIKLAKSGETLQLAPYDVVIEGGQGSLIGDSFNQFWANALNRRAAEGFTHFAMLHADIQPMRPDWLLSLLTEMTLHDAAVVSQIVAIKNHHGQTSAAWLNWPYPWNGGVIPANYRGLYHKRDCRNITTAELATLPRTWEAPPGQRLLMNTGCWIADLRAPCFNGPHPPYFCVDTWLTREPDGTIVKHCLPEDWHFALQVADLGGKVCCTQATPVIHWGTVGYKTHNLVEEPAPINDWPKDSGKSPNRKIGPLTEQSRQLQEGLTTLD